MNGSTSAEASFARCVGVVFSKDRPLQLDATLRSLKLNCSDLDLSTICVLYSCSSPRFAAQYRVVATEHPDVVFRRESRFQPDLIDLVQFSSHILFLVDDTLFVGPFSLVQATRLLDDDLSCLGFSLRLGTNTSYCHTLDKTQRLPAFQILDSGLRTFDWTDAEFDFGYPIEVSSSIYRTPDLLPLLTRLPYRNPNTLEGTLAGDASRFRSTRPRLACYSQSVAFSVPANLVQAVSDNRVDGRDELSASTLQDRHVQGDRLDVRAFQGTVPTACHQQVDFVYRRDPSYPTVSVVIPCYMQGQYLTEAVESVVAQSFRSWECIIVDDGSPDDTQVVARGLIARHPKRQIALISQENMGLPSARNAGIRAARGRYILPLDADDMIGTSMLESCVNLLETRPDIDIAYGEHQQRFGEQSSFGRLTDFDPFMLPYRNPLSYCSMYRSEVWDAVGGYNPNMNGGYEDWDFWIGAVEKGYRAEAAHGAVTWYRVRHGSMTVEALRRDRELGRRMRRNHPTLFRPWLRVARPAVWFSNSTAVAFSNLKLVVRLRAVVRLRTRLRSVRRKFFPRG